MTVIAAAITPGSLFFQEKHAVHLDGSFSKINVRHNATRANDGQSVIRQQRFRSKGGLSMLLLCSL